MKARVQRAATLLEFVLGILGGASATTARKMIKQGRVTVNGTPVIRPDTPLKKGQNVEVLPASAARPRARKTALPELPFPVLYEDDSMIAVSKPAGLLTIGTDKERMRTLYRMVFDYVKDREPGRRIFIVHRLDRAASGVIVFAKDDRTKRALQGSWTKVRKLYVAAVLGIPSPPEGTIRAWLAENKALRVYVCDEGTKGGELAITHYRLKNRLEGYSIVEVELETGKKHQIRVHLAHIGCPIAGDTQYGAAPKQGPEVKRGIALHAMRLEFTHPVTGKPVVIKAPRPSWLKGK